MMSKQPFTNQLSFLLISILPLMEITLFGLPLQAKVAKNLRVSHSQQPVENTAQHRGKGAGLKQGRGQAPGRRRGGGRRDDCPKVEIPLTAIVPQSEDTAENPPISYVGAITTAERPTFWFYVPYTLNAELTAEFILQDQAGTEIYKLSSVDLSSVEQTPGIISVPLPDTVSLEIGKGYEWYFKVNCGLEIPIYTNGGIERVALDESLSRQIADASPQEQARLYQENGFWYDAITILANLKRAQPNDGAIAEEWNRLLQVLGIEDILTAPASSS